MMTDTQIDQYSKERMKVREASLRVLLAQFGHNTDDNKSIYECADDWVSQGNVSTSGIVKYYTAYYR